jgi:predicted SAM-dependent methyltransferase
MGAMMAQRGPGGYAAHIVIYTHDFLLEEAVESVMPHVDQILVARTTRPWHGAPADLTETDVVLRRLQERYGERLEVYTDAFPDQAAQRNFLLTVSRARGHRGAFIVDCDEIFLEDAFPRMLAFIEAARPQALRIPYLTFIRDASFCVSPPHETNLFYLDLTVAPRFVSRRTSDRPETLMPWEEPGILHFSYIRETDEDIRRKVRNFSASVDTDWERWLAEVYLRFHPRLRDFHPVTPAAWRALIPFDIRHFPPALRDKLAQHGKLQHATHVAGRTPLKLHLGCGNIRLPGYVNIDLYNPAADLRLDITDLSYFEDQSVDELFLKAVLEHLYTHEQRQALAEWYRVLRPGGRLILRSLPDFDAVIEAYRSRAVGHVSPRFDLAEVTRYTHGPYTREDRLGQLHKDLFTREKLERLLTEAGFSDIRIENVCAPGEASPVNLDATAVKSGAPTASAVRCEAIWEGVYPGDGDWQWMADRGTLTVWAGGGDRPSLTFSVTCLDAAYYTQFPFRLRLYAWSRLVAEVAFERSHQTHAVRVDLPQGAGGPQHLRFASDGHFVPRELGHNHDDRRLALQLRDVRLEAGEPDDEGSGLLATAERAAAAGGWPEACQAYIRLLDADRNCAAARAGLGRALLALGDAEEGAAQLREAARLDPSPGMLRRVAAELAGAVSVGSPAR